MYSNNIPVCAIHNKAIIRIFFTKLFIKWFEVKRIYIYKDVQFTNR